MKKTRNIILGVLAVMLICALTVVGTMAYLTRDTGPVTNTFVAADLINPTSGVFTLNESPATESSTAVGEYTLDTAATKVTTNTYAHVVPGTTLPKDPTITVSGLGANAWLFLEVLDATPTTITYTMNTGWTELTGAHAPNGGTIYAWNAALAPAAAAQTFKVLSDDTLTVDAAYEGQTTDQTLTFYGYLTQAAGFDTASAAWNATFGATNP